ncbi:MAG TPA: SCO family protein [Vicinamibacterales bacterium]|nr:SCO family protein [Vicinamibacterales bacterium]
MIDWRLLIVGLVMAGVGAGCSRQPDARTYELTGQILVVKPETNEVLVKHEDIPGFMPAMTMPYVVKDPQLLAGRAAGDLITATLKVEPDLAHLTRITKTGSAPLPDDARTTIPAAAGVELLKPGDTVPDTPLIDQDGRTIALPDFAGSATALTFIYTRCPLPQYCPLMDRRFAEVQELAAKDASLTGKVRLLSVSFDPKFDRAAVLRQHAATLRANPAVWTFATAEEAVVDRFAARFGVNVIRESNDTITHNLRTAVIAPSGRITALLDSNAWTAADLVRELQAARDR